MLAITTKYIPATNTRGSRIKAQADKFTVTIPYPHELSGHKVHFKAVESLIEKYNLDWDIRNMRYGATMKGGYVFCFDASTV